MSVVVCVYKGIYCISVTGVVEGPLVAGCWTEVFRVMATLWRPGPVGVFGGGRDTLFCLLFVVCHFSALSVRKGRGWITCFIACLVGGGGEYRRALCSPVFFISLPCGAVGDRVAIMVVKGNGGNNGEVGGTRLARVLRRFFTREPNRALDFGRVFHSLRLAARPLGVLTVSVVRRVT